MGDRKICHGFLTCGCFNSHLVEWSMGCRRTGRERILSVANHAYDNLAFRKIPVDTVLLCQRRTPFEPSNIAVFPSLKNEFIGQIVNIFFEVFRQFYLKFYLKYLIISRKNTLKIPQKYTSFWGEIWRLLNIHKAFFPSVAVYPSALTQSSHQ